MKPLVIVGFLLHQPFACHFAISKSQVEDLSKYLDVRLRKNELPNFHQIEDDFRAREG
ncbi:hypothetical protein HDE77_003833 [Rhodanobacter sp. MP7CTX1]|nr:hypothetical protein [Rhodanobacter sp. MP7CTX1]